MAPVIIDAPIVLRVLKITLFGKGRSFRRVFWTLLFVFLLVVFSLGLAFARLIDWIFFFRFRRQAITGPVFIIGNPRSGTTFLHYLMTLDGERFTHFKLWQTIFPAICQHWAFRVIGVIDRYLLFRLLSRFVTWFERRVFRGWEGIHTIGFRRAEECEAVFVLVGLSPSWVYLFPFVGDIDAVTFIDRQPEKKRRRLMSYYRGILKRHLYMAGGNRTFLGKNVLHTGRLETVLEAFPDGRYVLLVRHPYQTLPSFLSMFTKPWNAHSPDLPRTSPEHRQMAELFIAYYKYMLAHHDAFDSERFTIVKYRDLVADPKGVVESTYQKLGIEMTAAFRERLERAASESFAYESTHDYALEDYGLTREWVYEQLEEVFEAYGFEP